MSDKHTRAYRGGVVSGASAELVDEAIRSMEESRDRERRRREKWGDNNRESMSRLCASFPTLRGSPGAAPWDSHVFLAWACGAEPGSGARHAARFVLAVWNNSGDWDAVAEEQSIEGRIGGRFDVVDALAVWDREHQAAFLAWAALPFWP